MAKVGRQMNKLNHVKPVPRRFLLELGAGAAIFGLIGTFSQAVKASLIENKDRGGWRFCTKCGVLFSLISNTICAAGGKHSQVGSLFYRLPTSKFFPQPNARIVELCSILDAKMKWLQGNAL
jgi:hypothetical protein